MYIPILKADSADALYMQLYKSIKHDLVSNRLSAGIRLPSKRVLSSLLGISVNTVDAAYQQLVSEGYMEARAKSGYYVNDLSAHISQSAGFSSAYEGRCSPDFSTEVSLSDDTSPFVSKMTSGIDARADIDFLTPTIDFSPNGVDLSALPLSKIKKTIREVFEEYGADVFASCEPQGTAGLRRALCRYVMESRGLICHPDQIIVGAGTDYILMLLVQILRSSHNIEAAAMESPVYNKAYQIFAGLQVPVELIPLDKHGIHMDSLAKSRANLVYTTPSHQFPLGIIMPANRRTELMAWASAAPDRYIIEDDYDSEFRYEGRPIPAISSLDTQNKVIYLGSFSKSIAPSVRISYLVVPHDLLASYKKHLYYYKNTVSHLDQLVLMRFIESGDFERHINRMRTLYRRKRDLFLQTLSPFKNKLRIGGIDAGLHLICHVNNKMTEEELVEKAKNAAAKVYGISSYYLLDSTDTPPVYASIPQSTVLLGYASLSDDQITQGVCAIAKAWQL